MAGRVRWLCRVQEDAVHLLPRPRVKEFLVGVRLLVSSHGARRSGPGSDGRNRRDTGLDEAHPSAPVHGEVGEIHVGWGEGKGGGRTGGREGTSVAGGAACGG